MGLGRISNILSRSEWTGIGVIVAIIIAVLQTMYQSQMNRIEPSELRSIANAINASNQDNRTKIYDELGKLLRKANVSDQLMQIVNKWQDPLNAIIIGKYVVVSTKDQYKIDGFVLIFSLETGELIFSAYDFKLGIKGVKVFDTKSASPEYLLIFKYMTLSGTGMYGESVRMYAIENQRVAVALDKPYKEYLDGYWGAYKSSVSFEQNNQLSLDAGTLKLTTVGQVSYENHDGLREKSLPTEEYSWNSNTMKFEQTSGRLTKDKQSMSEIYADYAEPNGDWFIKPRESNDTSFIEEQW